MIDRRMIFLAALAVACIVAFMSIGLRGNPGFVLGLRAIRLTAMIEIGVAIAVSTVVFQTVTANRILTPSIMGIDALYLFAQIMLVFSLGGFFYATLDQRLKFSFEVAALMMLSLGLILPMLRARLDMGFMLLVGVVIGVLFRSLHSLIARVIDPNDFAVAQVSSYATFNDVKSELLVVASLLTFASLAFVWRARHTLDILALGRDTAIGLGIDWTRTQVACLLLVSVLVAVSTALVGPIAFLGLLVVALAERIVGTRRHAVLIPAAALVAVIVLVGGQTLFQHVLGNSSTLGVVVELAGGIVFLVLLWRRSRK